MIAQSDATDNESRVPGPPVCRAHDQCTATPRPAPTAPRLGGPAPPAQEEPDHPADSPAMATTPTRGAVAVTTQKWIRTR